MTVLAWETAPPGCRVVFTTRAGGVSDGPYRALNLGMLTGDEPDRVVENRRRACASAGADAESATMARQVHGARVTQARPTGVVTPGADYEPCDGLWSDRPGQAMLLVTADCLPVALARAGGRPAVAVLHVGWRGLLAGVVANGVAALGGGETALAAAIGPGIGPCCYEVGEEVAGPFRERFGPDVLRRRNLHLPLAAERALAAAGVAQVERSDRCTACEPDVFFSHRRDRGHTGRQGIVAALV
jgi:polyphenol oxidase